MSIGINETKQIVIMVFNDTKMDKIKHMIAGFLISGLAGFFLQGLIVFIPALIAGLAKEFIWDKWLGKGTFEWKDIYFTCWGGALATILWYFL